MTTEEIKIKVREAQSKEITEHLICFLQVGIPHFCKIFSPAPVGKIKLT
jgi:hypothetical protein